MKKNLIGIGLVLLSAALVVAGYFFFRGSSQAAESLSSSAQQATEGTANLNTLAGKVNQGLDDLGGLIKKAGIKL